MKKLAYLLALFVGLNATAVVRKPDEEENQAIVVKDASRKSTAAWIQRIAHKLKACYYGITKNGLVHELGCEIIHKIQSPSSTNNDENSKIEAIEIFKKNAKNKLIWIHFAHIIENGNESCELDFM